MEDLIPEVSRLLNNTLSPEENLIASATESLLRLSGMPHFAHALLFISTGAETVNYRPLIDISSCISSSIHYFFKQGS